MKNNRIFESCILGLCLLAGLALVGYLLSNGLLQFKSLDRTVAVKGLSEREVAADVAIWPIRYSEADNDLNRLFSTIQRKNELIVRFLKEKGFKDEELSLSAPAIFDRQGQGYAETNRREFRYSGTSAITVYTTNVSAVRSAMAQLVELGKMGIAFSGQDYESKMEYLFTKLNDVKPGMIEEATKNAREVAERFAMDSKSKLGKIKRASQGQFSIADRDSNTPHIKRIRVVSTIEYYLSD
ncbi:MAG: SIMPL domain-containing protein [Deltaproteobacteria bacterium]|nr:SIMPL domain-containing protein [Deltaproteobacteria bacterium]